jgi:hypothetical protein
MKKLALINSYCNTWEKLTILLQNVKKLKELGVDSLVYSPVPLPREVTDQLDYVILTKENPIINWPERGIIHWAQVDPKYKITLIVPDYGWASAYQYKKLMEFGSTLDYDYYFWFLYDLNIDSIVEDTLKNSHNKLFFKSPKAKSSKVGGIFASFNKENLNKIHPLITKENYIEICKGQIAEYFVENICDKIKGEISNYETTDLIYEHNTLSFNKALETHPFKMFFTNEDDLKFVFWDIQKNNIIFTFNVNNKFYDFNLSKQNYISTTINLNDVKTIGYSYNGEYVDLLPYFNNTSKVLQLIENI